MTEMYILGALGAIALPFYIRLCVRIAAQAWFKEKRRNQSEFMNDLTRST